MIYLGLSDAAAICRRRVCLGQRWRFRVDETALFRLGSADGREVPPSATANAGAAASLDGLLCGLPIASLPLPELVNKSFKGALFSQVCLLMVPAFCLPKFSQTLGHLWINLVQTLVDISHRLWSKVFQISAKLVHRQPRFDALQKPKPLNLKDRHLESQVRR